MFSKLIGSNYLPAQGPELYQFFQECFSNKNIEQLQDIVALCEGDVNKFVFRKYWPAVYNNKKGHDYLAKDFARTEAVQVEEWFNKQNYPKENYRYDSLLQLAVEANWLEGVQYLLKHGAKVNCRNYYIRGYFNASAPSDVDTSADMVVRSTPLIAGLEFKDSHYSKKSKQELKDNQEIIQGLFKSGADGRLVAKHTTPLHEAIKGKHTPEVVSELIKRRANINAKDPSGFPPLAYANDYAAAQLLLKNNVMKTDENVEVQTNLNNINLNIELIAKLELHLKDKILSRCVKNPLTHVKAYIVTAFILFLKSHLTYSANDVIEIFAKEYKSKHNQDPFARLQEQRNTGFFYRFFFNPDYTATTQIFQDYLGSKKQILEEHFNENRYRL